jgi:hypothetical protein
VVDSIQNLSDTARSSEEEVLSELDSSPEDCIDKCRSER